MAFPISRLPIKFELLIDGVWTDYTSRTRAPSDQDGFDITRGMSGEGQTEPSAGRCDFKLNNRDGLLSNRNPNSALFGKIGRNVPFRTSVTEDTVFLKLSDNSDTIGSYDGAMVTTADKAVLDITGDLDVRIDLEPDNWLGGRGSLLISKYVTSGNQRSWALYLSRMGFLYFTWTIDGSTSTRLYATSTSRVASLGRQAVRATIDVNNGAAGKTVTFYTADTIAGPWTQLGAVVTTSGTTSIFSGSAPIEIGALSSFGRSTLNFVESGLTDPYCGKIYRAQIYSGIAGTLVADANFGAQAEGTTSFSDGLGTPNTWTTVASAELTAADYRFHGELPDLPQEWDETGTDVWIQTSGADITARLMTGARALESAIYRNVRRYLPSSMGSGTSNTLHGWWPMEQGSDGVGPTAVIGQNAYMSGGNYTSDTDFPGAAGVLSFTSDTDFVQGTAAAAASTGTAQFIFYFRAPAIPSGITRLDFMTFFCTGGTTARVDVGVNDTTYHLNIYNSAGTLLMGINSLFGGDGTPDQPMSMHVKLTQSGGNVAYELGWYPIGGGVTYNISGTYVGTIGRATSWQSNAFTGKSGWWISHLGLFREDISFTSVDFIQSTNAHDGERVDERFTRLCRQQGVRNWVIGRRYEATNDPVGEQMGPQTTRPFMDLVQECRDVDGGMLYAPRDKFGLTLRLKNSIINREPVRLDYEAQILSGRLKPRDDTFFVRNDVTVTRPNGGTGHAVKISGPNNVNEPADDPEGVGTFDPGSISRNVYTDAQLQNHAEDIVFLGTWDDVRFPNLQVNLERAPLVADPELTAQIRHLDLGDVMRGVNFPAWVPPDDQDMLNLGYTERLRRFSQEFIWNTQPYGPYRRAANLTTSPWAPRRIAASNSSLAVAMTDSTFSMVVSTPTGKLWGTTAGKPGNFPVDVFLSPNGSLRDERVRVASIATWLADDFGRATLSGSWGATSTGGFTWILGGTASDYTVVGTGFGRHNLSTVTTQRSTSLDLNARISEVRFGRVQMQALSGAGAAGEILIRLGTSTDFVQLKILPVVAGTATAIINQFVGGAETTFTSAVSTGLAANAAMSVVFQVIDTTARAKIYTTGTSEPSAWLTTLTMTAANAVGDLTLLSSRNASSTNVPPFNVEWDDLTVPRVQLFTLDARSVNGVVRAHNPDEFVQVVDFINVSR